MNASKLWQLINNQDEGDISAIVRLHGGHNVSEEVLRVKYPQYLLRQAAEIFPIDKKLSERLIARAMSYRYQIKQQRIRESWEKSKTN